jgi:hypothetical protein
MIRLSTYLKTYKYVGALRGTADAERWIANWQTGSAILSISRSTVPSRRGKRKPESLHNRGEFKSEGDRSLYTRAASGVA